jgi:hypothetical protein
LLVVGVGHGCGCCVMLRSRGWVEGWSFVGGGIRDSECVGLRGGCVTLGG